MKIELTRPLAFFDTETTGINRRTDRIIDLAIVKLMPDGSRQTYEYRFNPEMPIPPESTRIHGITDDDVRDCPTFAMKVNEVLDCFEGCDLCGFNIIGFDIPLLEHECRRADCEFDMTDRRVIDAQRIFHKKEPRDLSAALRFYCDKEHTDAHGALPDVEATIDVLEGQFERYEDLPTNADQLDEFCNPSDPRYVDRTGRIAWNSNGEAAINFGKHSGHTLRELVLSEPGFLRWILKNDFPGDTQHIVRQALAGFYPQRGE